jgi:hypothetical protein
MTDKIRQAGMIEYIDFTFSGFRIGDKVRMKPILNENGTIKKTVRQDKTIYTIQKYFTLSKQVKLLSPLDDKAFILMNVESIEKVKEE